MSKDQDVPYLEEFVDGRAPTPSLNDTPCPNVLGRLEWVGGAEGVEGEGAGDCDRVEGAVFAGGPFAQADFDESWDDVFGADAVDGLLILSGEIRGTRGALRGKIRTKCSDGFD